MKFSKIPAGFFDGIFSAPTWPAWIRSLRGKSGVYIIRRTGGPILYVGESHTGRLYQTFTRHFQAWTGKTAGNTYSRGSVEVCAIVTPPGRALARQNALIVKLQPQDNKISPSGALDENPF